MLNPPKSKRNKSENRWLIKCVCAPVLAFPFLSFPFLSFPFSSWRRAIWVQTEMRIEPGGDSTRLPASASDQGPNQPLPPSCFLLPWRLL
jgi:hypothetical protein